MDLASVAWNGLAPTDSELLHEEDLGSGFGGGLQDWKFEWIDLPGNLASNLLTFAAAGSSLSLDWVAVDTIAVEAVPEASSLAMLAGVTLAAVGIRRLRRHREIESK